MKKIAGSFLSSLDDEFAIIDRFNRSMVDQIHLDIMDGSMTKSTHILPNEVLKYLVSCEKPVDVHLMVKDPSGYLPILLDSKKVERIALHAECAYTYSYLKQIQKCSKKAGVALLKDSSLDLLKDYLAWVDYVLILSVPIGKSGQSFDSLATQKLEFLAEIREKNHYSFEIWVDGGIDSSVLEQVVLADGLISGSYLQQDPDQHTFLLKK